MNDGSISTGLYQFLATNFHQDWDLEADDWQGIVDNHVKDNQSAGALQALAQEVDHLREACSEKELRQFLVHSVGVDYGPEPLSYGDWLGLVAGRLRAQAAAAENGGV